MFNLIVRGSPWSGERDSFPAQRIFEYTESVLSNIYRPSGELDIPELIKLPTLFVTEIFHGTQQLAYVGMVNRMRLSGTDYILECSYDNSVPPLTNAVLLSLSTELDIHDPFEFSRTHWSIKNVDLYRFLLKNSQPRRPRPSVFSLAEPENIEPTLVSAMMPFEQSFDSVYGSLKSLAEQIGLRCRRADDIWENPAVMQDVVSLIDRSKIVIADCTGRNPNVFYEIGIAHTLGRNVILITQNEGDIPFDLRHLRFVKYLNNQQGLNDLGNKLRDRMSDLAL